jgi:dynein light chain LC8-type
MVPTVNVGRAWNERTVPTWSRHFLNLLLLTGLTPHALQFTHSHSHSQPFVIDIEKIKQSMSEKIDATSTSTDASIGGTASTAVGGGPKAIVKNVDMSEEMQQESVDIASAALEKYNIEKDIAAQIKKEFDKRYGPTWHVVVGRNFGSYVTHGTPFL